MALHSDLSLRAANLEILSNVLQSGMTLESLDGQSSTNPISSLFAVSLSFANNTRWILTTLSLDDSRT